LRNKRKEGAKRYPQGYFFEKKCRHCGKDFTPVAPSQFYCSNECADYGHLNAYYLRVYGITKEAYEHMKKEQNYRCAICGGEGFIMNTNQNQTEKIVVDHDHTTGKVRGLLCHNCNRGLGLFKDNPELLRKAAEYVNLYNADATTIRKE
jgi:hypothetical protein